MVDSNLAFSTSRIFLISSKFSESSGNIGLRYSACHVQMSGRLIFHSYLSMKLNALLRMTRRLYPPPTFDGRAPSFNANNNDRACSATLYNPARGNIFSFNSSTPIPTFFATNFQVLLMSSTSSTFR